MSSKIIALPKICSPDCPYNLLLSDASFCKYENLELIQNHQLCPFLYELLDPSKYNDPKTLSLLSKYSSYISKQLSLTSKLLSSSSSQERAQFLLLRNKLLNYQSIIKDKFPDLEGLVNNPSIAQTSP